MKRLLFLMFFLSSHAFAMEINIEEDILPFGIPVAFIDPNDEVEILSIEALRKCMNDHEKLEASREVIRFKFLQLHASVTTEKLEELIKPEPKKPKDKLDLVLDDIEDELNKNSDSLTKAKELTHFIFGVNDMIAKHMISCSFSAYRIEDVRVIYTE